MRSNPAAHRINDLGVNHLSTFTLRQRLAAWALGRLLPIVYSRRPDVIIGERSNPYLLRWHVIPRNSWFNVYLHEILRSDDDRALHDHPYTNLSVILEGGYVEHTIAAGGIHHQTRRQAGDLKLRGPRAAHRLEVGTEPCWTLLDPVRHRATRPEMGVLVPQRLGALGGLHQRGGWHLDHRPRLRGVVMTDQPRGSEQSREDLIERLKFLAENASDLEITSFARGDTLNVAEVANEAAAMIEDFSTAHAEGLGKEDMASRADSAASLASELTDQQGGAPLELFAELPQPLRAHTQYINAALTYYHGGPADLDVRIAWDFITKTVAEFTRAMAIVERWHGEFPVTGRTWDDGSPMSYAAQYGSNGERDYMRSVARAAFQITGLQSPSAASAGNAGLDELSLALARQRELETERDELRAKLQHLQLAYDELRRSLKL